jgi:hypothetical protein
MTINLDHLADKVDSLRKRAIGEPIWLNEKNVFEYQEKSAKVLAVLKLVRAMHGVGAMNVLTSHGFLIDVGAIMRCIVESSAEITFVLENYPNASPQVEEYVRGFFSNTIDGYLSAGPNAPGKKVRAASVRYLKGGPDHETHQMIERIYKSYSGYVHAHYVHIMEVYSPSPGFNLRGCMSLEEQKKRMEIVDCAAVYVLQSAMKIAQKLGFNDFFQELLAMDPS